MVRDETKIHVYDVVDADYDRSFQYKGGGYTSKQPGLLPIYPSGQCGNKGFSVGADRCDSQDDTHFIEHMADGTYEWRPVCKSYDRKGGMNCVDATTCKHRVGHKNDPKRPFHFHVRKMVVFETDVTIEAPDRHTAEKLLRMKVRDEPEKLQEKIIALDYGATVDET